MTQLLEEAIDAVKKLPTPDQDAIASLILEELADERRWDAAFAASQDPFDLWFKQGVQEFTGIDFGQPLPPIQQLLDWRR